MKVSICRSWWILILADLYFFLLTSCGPGDELWRVTPLNHSETSISDSMKQERIRLIARGLKAKRVKSALLIAGIASAESGLAHCWSEAMWACQGPASSSCKNGPVIAGSADGPCSIKQGGLGMFQFDAGTYNQTLAQYGNKVLTVEGNAAAVIPFFVGKLTYAKQTAAKYGLGHVKNEQDFVDWLNSIQSLKDPKFENWLGMVSCLYNGSCSGQKIGAYRAATSEILDAFGKDIFFTQASGDGAQVTEPEEEEPEVEEEIEIEEEKPAPVISIKECPKIEIVRTNDDAINVRTQPSLSAKLLGKTKAGKYFRVLDFEQDGDYVDDPIYPTFSSRVWIKVRIDEKRNGWLSAVYARCFE